MSGESTEKNENKTTEVAGQIIDARKDERGEFTYGFKFTPAVGDAIYEYLQTRPMNEVEGYINSFFETKIPRDQVYLSEEGIKDICEYFKAKCPRKDAKPLLALISNGGMEQFKIYNEQKGAAKEEKAAE